MHSYPQCVHLVKHRQSAVFPKQVHLLLVHSIREPLLLLVVNQPLLVQFAHKMLL
jgi:hypothetical protein